MVPASMVPAASSPLSRRRFDQLEIAALAMRMGDLEIRINELITDGAALVQAFVHLIQFVCVHSIRFLKQSFVISQSEHASVRHEAKD